MLAAFPVLACAEESTLTPVAPPPVAPPLFARTLGMSDMLVLLLRTLEENMVKITMAIYSWVSH